jgi:hypothetical protein
MGRAERCPNQHRRGERKDEKANRDPVIRLKLIKKPATLQARNQYQPRPPGWPRRLHPKTPAISTRSGHARINVEPDATSIPGRGTLAGGRRRARRASAGDP